MAEVVVIGSGASGVHFALTLLKKGYDVVMLDVGRTRPEAVNPEYSFDGLKRGLDDPVEYFLGGDFRSVILPGNKGKYYGLPPSKGYVLASRGELGVEADGFSPLASFARGGLAEAWTAGSYPFGDAELADFPFGYDDIEPYYSTVAERIGITGAEDDLSAFLPFHANITGPLRLDAHSSLLLESYQAKKRSFNRKGFYLGRSRVATLADPMDGRQGCTYCGRCLWGCPTGALYTPSMTLDECMDFKNFTYVPGVRVTHFDYDSGGRATKVFAARLDDGKTLDFKADHVALAAGALGSSKIFLDSIWKKTGRIKRLTGLMDNRQVLVPFVNLKMAGRPVESEAYQYNLIAMGLVGAAAKDYVHMLVTTLTSSLVHPLIESFPFDLRTSTFLFSRLHAALGIVNVNFPDTRREGNYVTITPGQGGTGLSLRYAPAHDDSARVGRTITRLRRLLRKLGCVAPSAMTHVRPMGASVHYAGTLPMTRGGGPLTTDELCRSVDFPNLYVVDGATFPFLPAKNCTQTLMANAV
ncbi:MAG: GMC oxidoreductase, partial [Thermodesulfobacteriota bacterium]